MAYKKCLLVLLLVFPFFLQAQTEQEQEWLKLIRQADDYSAGSKYDSALIVSQKVALAAEEEKNYEFMTRSYLAMGSVYIWTSKMELASEIYDKARKYAEMWGNASFIARADLAKGLVYDGFAVKANDPNLETYDSLKTKVFLDSALYFYEKSRQYYLQNDPDNSLMLANVAENFSNNYYRRNNYSESIAERRMAVKLYKITGYDNYYIRNIYWLGNTFLKAFESGSQSEQYLDSAQKHLSISFQLSIENDMSEIARIASKDLAFVNQYLNNSTRALFYWNQADSLLKEIYSKDYDDRVLELRAQYQTATAELEAAQATSRSLRLEKNRNITLIVGASILVIFSIWLYVIDQRRKSIKAIAAKNDELNKQRIDELLQQQEIASLQGVLEGQEQERKRVAIDLHDRLGGILSMVKLHFSAVEEKLPEDNPEKKKFLTASELLDLAAGEVRNISHNLLSGVLAKFGLLPALKDLTDRINESGEIKLNLIYHGVENALNGEQELQVYRIVQELISNILKHSDASEATIQLIRNDEERKVNLIVEDDGKGFDPLNASSSDGIGLSNLKARVGKLNGSFHIDSGKGAGTSISIDIPIEDD